MPKDIFDSNNEVQATSTVAWNKVGDFISGTYIGVRRQIQTIHGPKDIYQILARKGTWTTKDKDTETAIENQVYGIWGKDDILCAGLNQLKVGQNVGCKLVEIKKSNKGNPAKIVKVYTDGTMNEQWLEQQEPTDGEV